MVLPSRLHTIETERRCGPITRLNANVRASSARFRRPGGRDGGSGRTRGFASVATGRVARGAPVAQRGFQRTRPGDGSGAHEERVSSLPGPLPAVRAPAPASARPRTHGGAGGTPPQSPAQRVLGGRARAVLGAMVCVVRMESLAGETGKGETRRVHPGLPIRSPPVTVLPPGPFHPPERRNAPARCAKRDRRRPPGRAPRQRFRPWAGDIELREGETARLRCRGGPARGRRCLPPALPGSPVARGRGFPRPKPPPGGLPHHGVCVAVILPQRKSSSEI